MTIGKVLKWGLGAVMVLAVGLAGYLRFAPPDLLRVATNYSAKIVCSSVFLSGRDADEVLAVDVQAPGHPLLGYVSVDVDRTEETVSARLFGFAAPATAQHRAGLGCTNAQTTTLSAATLPATSRSIQGLWPAGEDINPSQDPAIVAILSDPALLGDGYRAVVAVKDGRIIGETYADGFDPDMPLLGWSMTKTVTAAIIGTLIQSGQVSLADDLSTTFGDWAADERAAITVTDLLGMSSGLAWNEGYGNVSDVTRMLYLTDNMASFAAAKPAQSGVQNVFNYSSGTSTMLSRFWQDRVGADALAYPQRTLFQPLGMASATLETDATDTIVGSSYMYATARDWARFGQFLLQDGVWRGQQLLPAGYVNWMVTPVDSSAGDYANGHLWLEAPRQDVAYEDAFWLQGHDGQSIGIIPSQNLVVVRLGLSPSRLGYSSLPVMQALISATQS